MPRDHDAILLESVRVHRARLRAAFLHGDLLARRTTNDNVRRFVGSTVIAAVISAGFAGYSFYQANAGSLRGGVSPAAVSPAAVSPAATSPSVTQEAAP
ncbi:hypothetical protein [Cellulomonas fimi]|uniref:Uncharacterized protein n=1 Tax=Cellulomonas fimi TaxID=1708 RepID=A0A7Y0M151_CELFI|nr:hypothetical protein [Cellulomonas fimi]NMR21605.1 hypothetical protein [Cellulomonas fimi]